MIRYLNSVSPLAAKGMTAQVYKQIRRDFGAVVEPFLLHAAIPELLAGVWAVVREIELTGSVPRELKEVVAASVSQQNRCPYCVDAHAVMLHAADYEDAAAAILFDQGAGLPERVQTIILWTQGVTAPDVRWAQERLPFAAHEAPEFIGTAVFYCYINRLAQIFLGETPLPGKSRSPLVKKWLLHMGGLIFGPAVRRAKSPGESLRFLAPAPLPVDLGWAGPNPYAAAALARMTQVVAAQGEMYLPATGRNYVQDYLHTWRGEWPPMSRAWVEPHLARVPLAERPCLRLLLLTAVAPTQVDARIIAEFRAAYGPEDARLLAAVAWASWLAARRVGGWMMEICASLYKG